MPGSVAQVCLNVSHYIQTILYKPIQHFRSTGVPKLRPGYGPGVFVL